MMRIAHVLWGLTTGGIETMVIHIIEHQVRNHQVALFLVNDYYHESLLSQLSKQCKLIMCGRQVGSKNPLPILKLNYQLFHYHPDIVHLHSKGLSKIIFTPCLKVRTIHATFNSCDEYPKMSRLYSISKTVQDFTYNQGYESILVENGIPVKLFGQKNKQYQAGDVLRIVQLGRLHTQQKGQHLLIEAVEKLVHTYHHTSLRVHFIGDGEDRAMLEDMVMHKGLQDYFTFEGVKSQDYVCQHLKDYDLLVQPSLLEGFGLTVAEAMAAKVPVLVSDIEGPMEIIDHGKYGFSFHANDVDDLALSIKMMMDTGINGDKVEQGHTYVKQKYDVSLTAERYIYEYQQVLSSHKK